MFYMNILSRLVKKNLTIKKVLLVLSMIKITYYLNHNIFNILYNLNLNYVFEFKDYKIEVILNKESLAAIFSLLFTLSIKGFLEEIIELYLMADTGDSNSNNNVSNT